MGDLVKEVVVAIRIADQFLLSTHINPDGDGIGSILALSWILKKLGKRHVMVIDDKVPEMFSYLDGYRDILSYEDGMVLPFSPKCFVSLDVANIDRVKRVNTLLDKDRTIINIDHHLSNSKFGDINLVDAKASSCSEVMYYLVEEFGFELDRSVAEAIYTGIAIDTGRFRFASTTAGCMRISGNLIDAGARVGMVADRIFYDNNLATIMALAEVLSNISINLDGKFAASYLGNDFYYNNDNALIDTEGFVNYPLTIKGVQVSLLLQESVQGVVRGSLRSKEGSINVNDVAGVFGGGGHARAAGFVIKGKKIDSVKEMVLRSVQDLL